MTQVDFHIVPVLQAADRYAYAARLVNKARSHKHRVLLAAALVIPTRSPCLRSIGLKSSRMVRQQRMVLTPSPAWPTL